MVAVNMTYQDCGFNSRSFLTARKAMVHKLSLIVYWVNKYMAYLPISVGAFRHTFMQSFLYTYMCTLYMYIKDVDRVILQT